MKNLENELIEIFCRIDDFNQAFIQELHTHQLTTGTRKKIKPCSMSESEIMTIIIFFHLILYRDFKHYYLFHVCKHMKDEFTQLVSYNRFVELSHSVLLPLVVFLKTQRPGKCSGISFIDSTPIRACHIKREHSHKVLRGLDTKGHCSIGWFFGMKMHFIVNDQGEKRSWILSLLPGMLTAKILCPEPTCWPRSMESLLETKGISPSVSLKSFS